VRMPLMDLDAEEEARLASIIAAASEWNE